MAKLRRSSSFFRPAAGVILAMTFLVLLSVAPRQVWADSSTEETEEKCTGTEEPHPDYWVAYQVMEDQMQRPPDELKYCQGDFPPRWVARWDVYESLEGWRKFATSVCFLQEPVRCRLMRHVVVPDSHEVIDLQYDAPLDQVRDLYGAARAEHPSAEVAAIAYVEVTDGGAWSAGTHGYTVRFLEPPDFRGGDIIRYVLSCSVACSGACSDGCAWSSLASTASWIASGSNVWLRDLQREQGRPLLDVLHYLGR